jgi:hypothetical protein
MEISTTLSTTSWRPFVEVFLPPRSLSTGHNVEVEDELLAVRTPQILHCQ